VISRIALIALLPQSLKHAAMRCVHRWSVEASARIALSLFPNVVLLWRSEPDELSRRRASALAWGISLTRSRRHR
jgi:hypothetical protein